MSSNDLIYSIKLDSNSATARFYLWLYEAKPRTSCTLFWGLILAPILLIPILAIKGGGNLVARWERHHPPKPKQIKPTKSREEKLDSFSNRASGTYAKYQTAFRVAAIIIGILLGIALLGGLVYLLIAHTIKVLIALAWVVGVTLVGALAIGLGVFFGQGKGQGFTRLVRDLFRSFHQHTCAKIDLQ